MIDGVEEKLPPPIHQILLDMYQSTSRQLDRSSFLKAVYTVPPVVRPYQTYLGLNKFWGSPELSFNEAGGL